MSISRYSFLLLLFLLPLISSCIKEDPNPDPLGNPDVNFTAKTDGVPFESGGFFVAAVLSINKIGLYTFVLEAFDYDDINTGKGRAIGLTFSGFDFDNLQNGAEFVDWDVFTGEGALGVYNHHESFEEFVGGPSVGEEGSSTAYVKITAIDKVNQLISGEFSFVAYDEETSDQYQITEGRFTDLNYVVQD